MADILTLIRVEDDMSDDSDAMPDAMPNAIPDAIPDAMPNAMPGAIPELAAQAATPSEEDSSDDSDVEGALNAARTVYLRAAADAGVTPTITEIKDTYAARWTAIPPAWTIAEDGKLDLTDDPDTAVEINNQHRRADAPDGKGSGLWTVDQFRAGAPRVYRYNAPTFAPAKWGTARSAISQETYSRTFAGEFPEIANILPMSNVAVAGGAAAWPFGDATKKASDVDFFLFGLPADNSEESRKIRWSCVGALVGRIRAQFVQCVELLSAGVVTMKCSRRHDPNAARQVASVVKIQIILRAYQTPSAIVHGFDVPSCSVIYDGHVACMTYLAAFAHMFHANIVVPAYRSTTYEARILKYFERGYALVMPNLNMAALSCGERLTLPNMIIHPATIRGRFATGSVALTADPPESDYSFAEDEPSRYSRWRDCSGWINGQARLNLKMVAADRPVIMIGTMIENPRNRRRRRDPNDPSYAGLPFATFWQEPTRSSILPQEEMVDITGATARAIVSKTGKIDTTALYKIFKLTPAQVIQLTHEVSEKWEVARIGKLRIDVSPSLQRFSEALYAQYSAQPDRIDWWILEDTTRQHTSSLNPRCEDPAQWYGAAYAATIAPPTSQESLETIIGVYEARMNARDSGAAFDGTCSLCHDAVHSGDINSITLPCGHVFHWATSAGCGGLCLWVVSNNRSCPLCRADFLGDDNQYADRPPAFIPISIVL
jgi:hypothetical protein